MRVVINGDIGHNPSLDDLRPTAVVPITREIRYNLAAPDSAGGLQEACRAR